MPPLVIASAHTQGTLVSFLQSFESCHGPIAPFSYFTSRFYLCGNVHVFFCDTYTKVWILLSCSAPSFPLILLNMYASLSFSLFRSHYSVNWRCCIWGLWWSSCSLPLRPINRSLIHASFCLLHLHHWESLVVAPQQVKWAFSIQLMIISHSLNLNVLQRVSFQCHPPTFTHFSAVIRQGSGTFSCKDSLLLFLPRYLHIFVESILLLRDWKVFLAPSWC